MNNVERKDSFKVQSKRAGKPRTFRIILMELTNYLEVNNKDPPMEWIELKTEMMKVWVETKLKKPWKEYFRSVYRNDSDVSKWTHVLKVCI